MNNKLLLMMVVLVIIYYITQNCSCGQEGFGYGKMEKKQQKKKEKDDKKLLKKLSTVDIPKCNISTHRTFDKNGKYDGFRASKGNECCHKHYLPKSSDEFIYCIERSNAGRKIVPADDD